MTALGHGLADAAEADDAERLAGDLAADHVGRPPSTPFAGPYLPLALACPPSDRKQQRHGDVGGAICENAGRVGDDDAGSLGGRDVDVIVADAIVAEDLRAEAATGEEVGRKSIRNCRKNGVIGPECFSQFCSRQRHVPFVQGDVEAFGKHLLHRRRPTTGDENAGFRAHACLRIRIAAR